MLAALKNSDEEKAAKEAQCVALGRQVAALNTEMAAAREGQLILKSFLYSGFITSCIKPMLTLENLQQAKDGSRGCGKQLVCGRGGAARGCGCERGHARQHHARTAAA